MKKKNTKVTSTTALPCPEKEKAAPVWHCSTYCRKVRYISCEGQAYVQEDAPDLCPYFDEMLY